MLFAPPYDSEGVQIQGLSIPSTTDHSRFDDVAGC